MMSFCVCVLIFKAALSLPLPIPDSSAPFLRQASFFFLSFFFSPLPGMECGEGERWVEAGLCTKPQFDSLVHCRRRAELGLNREMFCFYCCHITNFLSLHFLVRFSLPLLISLRSPLVSSFFSLCFVVLIGLFSTFTTGIKMHFCLSDIELACF